MPTLSAPTNVGTRRHVRLGGVETVFELGPGYDEALTEWLGESAPKGAGDGVGLRFDLRAGPAPDPAPGTPITRLGPVGLWRHDGVLHLRGPAGLGGEIDLDAGSGKVWAPTNGGLRCRRALHTCLRPLWFLGLGRYGLYTLHSSAVTIDGRAVLAIGNSGAGKSTFAARLASSGAGFVTDDMVMVSDHPTVMAGLADTARLSGREANALGLTHRPHLDNKVAADLSSRRDRSPVVPRLLLFLDGPAGENRALTASEAMARLLGAALLTIDPAADGRRMSALARLAERCPARSIGRRPPTPSPGQLMQWMEEGND